MRTQQQSSKPKVVGDPATGLFGDEDTIDLLGVFGIMRRRKWLIMSVCFIGTLIACVVGLQLTPSYTAKASVMIEPHQPQVVNYQAVLGSLGTDPSTVSTQVAVLQSRTRTSVMPYTYSSESARAASTADTAATGSNALASAVSPRSTASKAASTT